jgi:hypothetical protein
VWGRVVSPEKKRKTKDEENVRLAWVLLAAVIVADAELGRIGLVGLPLFFLLCTAFFYNVCI